MDDRVTSGPIYGVDMCDNCGRKDWGAEKPKRCSGCKVMLYCNRDCQKAAWKTHRTMCRSAPQTDMKMSFSDIGYSTPMAAGSALHKWYLVHQWSLNAIGDAVINLHGGINALLAASEPVTIVFTVKAGQSTEAGGNPAKAFRLFNVSIVHNAEHYAIVNRGDEMLQRRNITNAQLRSMGSFADPTFAGMFCAAFVVDGTGVVNHELFALYRFPLRHVSSDLRDTRTRRALTQSVELLRNVIASGAVLRYSGTPSRVEPKRGHYVHAKGDWRFQLLPDDWESLGNPNGETVLNTELTPLEMLTLFDSRGSALQLRNLDA